MTCEITKCLESLCPHILRRVTESSESQEPANREAVYEVGADGSVVVVVHVKNGTNGQRLLVEMAEAIERQIAGSLPQAEVAECPAEETATTRVLIIRSQEKNDATTEA